MQPFIENCSYTDIRSGCHYVPGDNAILISIVDPAGYPPRPKYKFKEIHRFEFLDAEDTCPFPEEAKFSKDDAKKIVEILKTALENKSNVIVHCMAGICRSGAIVEVGVMMGFAEPGKRRQPNLRVKKMLMEELGWTYE